MGRVLVHILAFIGGATVLVGGAALMFSGPPPPFNSRVDRTLPSPSGAYTATQVTRTLGGATGSCQQLVAVVKSTEPITLIARIYSGSRTVFSADCGTAVDVLWQSASELKIRFAAGPSGADVYMRSATQDGAVKITYDFIT